MSVHHLRGVSEQGQAGGTSGWWHVTQGTFHPNFWAVSDLLILQQCYFFSVVLVLALHKVLFPGRAFNPGIVWWC